MQAEPGDDPLLPTSSSTPDAPALRPTAAPAHRWGLGAFVLVELVYLLSSTLLALVVASAGPRSAALISLAVAAPTVIAAGLAVFITMRRGNGPRTDLRMGGTWRDVRLGLVFGLGGLVVSVPASMLYASITGPDANSALYKVFGDVRASWPWAVAVFIVVVFVGPLCEEILYRGLLWGALERRWGQWVALVVSTAVFALAHCEFTRAPLLLVIAVPIALARLYSGGLWASIVAHQVTNSLPGLVLMLILTGTMPAS
ncbi:putative secreted protein [Mycobacterium liflandii 128FXT]|uniref:Secreted protein n=1 Tax=Mycobacterium liflandii (strain 128FXT) TaxID=459424 RepID=L7V154_MYCL1|nr:putative secreted protein [Mycobacterium liflandii 128FXT]